MKFIKDWVRKSVAEQSYQVSIDVKAIFMILSHLTKVRGYKTVVKFFPHEVSDMEPVTEMLHFCDCREF
jgi:tubulin-specific chaperone D